jgi:hypothetical protein
MKATDGNISIDVEITLSQPIPGHRFISVNGSLLRNDISTSRVLPINGTVHKTTQKNLNPVENNWFSVMRLASRGIDALWRRLTVAADYRSVGPFLLQWDFGNTSCENSEQSAKPLMSFSIGYFLAVFGFYLRFDSGYFTQRFLLVLGITGGFPVSPLNCFTGVATGAWIGNHILMAVIMAVVSVFVLLGSSPSAHTITHPRRRWSSAPRSPSCQEIWGSDSWG